MHILHTTFSTYIRACDICMYLIVIEFGHFNHAMPATFNLWYSLLNLLNASGSIFRVRLFNFFAVTVVIVARLRCYCVPFAYYLQNFN